MSNDRRRTERDRRNDPRTPAVFAVKGVIGPSAHLCQCQDIGPTGISLFRPGGLPLAAGMTVKLSFALPGDGREIAATGVVMSDRRLGRLRRTGVQFTSVDASMAQRIQDFCAQRPRYRYADDEVAAAPY